jgi:hypothetical protein
MLHAQRDEIRMIDAELAGEAVDLALLGQRNRIVGAGHGEDAPEQRELLLVGSHLGKLAGHEKIRRTAEEQIARLGKLHDEHGLLLGELTLPDERRFHRARFLRRDVLVGVRDAAEQVCERGEIARASGLEVIERIQHIAERDSFRRFGPVEPKPGANRLHGHILG